ncbi:glycosyltransferase family 4 protein [Psychrobium sp. 1_MG-2023]|uniref:glycosyltransferase family 4 protein n=1 Tax=Psychrobium sp. 1_MG-2023 TaxID=3062624 RepID=UPI0026CB1592|nr:glycosyltransferase family 4 protein [Psychrobium sp. 1_MG-2023]MDP2561325.1 glycosyltransferase family 4 protein [Psychrobium sp. 1_MG-2023]
MEKVESKRVPILFVHYGEDWIRGSERCLLDLLKCLNKKTFKPIVWCNSQIMAAQVRRLGVTTYCQPFTLLLGWHKPFFDFNGFRQLIHRGETLVDRHHVKIIHSNSGGPCQWLNFVARKRQIPLLAHLHCRYPLRDRFTLGLHWVTKSIAVSQPIARQLLDDSVRKDRVEVISNGIDSARLCPEQVIDIRQLLGFDAGDIVLFSTGSLIERKGMDLIISAIGKARLQYPHIKLVIAGSGECHEQLCQQIEAFELQDSVFLLGERDDVPSLLQGGIDIFISGAREEVFGLVLAEAGLHGIPVIAPRVGGIPEVIQDGETGILVEPNDIMHLAQAIEKLVSRPNLRKQLGNAAKAYVEERFLIERNVAQFERCYCDLVKQHQATNTVALKQGWWLGLKSLIHFIAKLWRGQLIKQ